MKKDQTTKIKVNSVDLEILGEALVESERVVYILGDEQYIARYNHITEVIADQMVKLYKKREKAKKRRFRYQKVRFGLWG